MGRVGRQGNAQFKRLFVETHKSAGLFPMIVWFSRHHSCLVFLIIFSSMVKIMWNQFTFLPSFCSLYNANVVLL
jgi:hypothetical protein